MARRSPGATLLGHGAVFLEAIDDMAERDWRGLPAPSACSAATSPERAFAGRTEAQLELWDVEPRWVVASASACGVTNGYDHPNRLGVDRWVALIGARQRVLGRGPAVPALVVMVGTTVTVDALDAGGRFLGGLILPGFGLMLRALEMPRTAGLKAPTGEAVEFPTNTSDALMSGGADAIAGAVDRMHRKLERHTGTKPVILMTGGAAVKLASITDLPVEMVETLIFDGLLHLQAKRPVPLNGALSRMSTYAAETIWLRGDASREDFLASRYSRRHLLRFDGGVDVPGSSSPSVVPLPFSEAHAVDPEEAFVSSLSSCHMLWFLSLAVKQGFCVLTAMPGPRRPAWIAKQRRGRTDRDDSGDAASADRFLRREATEPGRDRARLHLHSAHEACFIANSVKTEVRCEPVFAG